MLEKPLISIALCTFNGDRFLREQLDTLVNQDYPSKEIVAVDDASSDTTLSILQEYAEKFPFISIHENQQNIGFRKSFERAILLSKGSLIALCDQDDVWMPEKLTLMEAQIGENQLIYHDSAFIKENGQSLNKNMSDVVNMYAGDNYKPFLFFNSVSGHACMFKRSLVPYILPLPVSIYHDHWIAYVAANLGTISYIARPLVQYRQHDHARTNILKVSDRKPIDYVSGKNKILSTLAGFETMSNFKFNKEPAFLRRLVKIYRKRLTLPINFNLITFMFEHYQSFLCISKKNAFSNTNFIFKHLWGLKLK
ncbi:glycosyltransferase family 2 protein [Pedobacter sp.]|uniref:glycosyltransferase family 2 protein n=1 Tax=Pedobacter sp. TaxID=1411316 RepID=UPI003D7F8C90